MVTKSENKLTNNKGKVPKHTGWNVIKEYYMVIFQSTCNSMGINNRRLSIKYFINGQCMPTKSIHYICSLKENINRTHCEKCCLCIVELWIISVNICMFLYFLSNSWVSG